MVNLAISHDWRQGIELGLGSGLLFSRFLALGIRMIGVDIGRRTDRRNMVADAVSHHPDSTVFWLPTQAAVSAVPDDWADFIFVDAAHSYEAVRQDISDWQRKLKPGGWFGGHDYHPKHPGVVKAVDEAFGNRIKLHGEAVWSRA